MGMTTVQMQEAGSGRHHSLLGDSNIASPESSAAGRNHARRYGRRVPSPGGIARVPPTLFLKLSRTGALYLTGRPHRWAPPTRLAGLTLPKRSCVAIIHAT